MSTFTVTIGSAFSGGQDTVRKIKTPLDTQMAYELGTEYPTAQQLANWFAGEYCDSGTVSVRGSRAGERGLVARSTLAG